MGYAWHRCQLLCLVPPTVKLCLPTLDLLHREDRFRVHELSSQMFVNLAVIEEGLLESSLPATPLALRDLTELVLGRTLGFGTRHEIVLVYVFT